MNDAVIKVDRLGKRYSLGQVHTNLLSERLGDSLHTFYQKIRGRISVPAHGAMCSASSNDENFWALKDVSFEVKQGEVVGIIGRNGAGKSTLLKILSRITTPTEGKVEIYGRVGSLLEVGTGFHPELTGRENIFLNGAILGMTKAEIREKFDEIVDFAEVEKFIDTPVKRYSSGMYVRLAFAVAAHLEPEILLVDEVLAVGDIAFQKKCMGKMGEVAREGRTVLFVSHNMAAIRTLCTRAICLEGGTIYGYGQPDEVVVSYVNNLMRPSQGVRKLSGTRFVNVSVIDSDKNKVETVTVGERAYLLFEVFIENNSGINLGFTLFREDDVPLISSCANDTFGELQKGSTKLKIELPIALLPSGRYRVEGAIWRTGEILDQSDFLTTFNILRDSYLETKGIDYRGLLILPNRWMIYDE